MDEGTRRRNPTAQEIDQWHALKPLLKQLGVRYRTGAEMFNGMWDHCTTQETGGGLRYYRTIRNRDSSNKVYLLWQGESIEQIKAAMSELRFLYDHLPKIQWWVLSPLLLRKGYRVSG